MNPEQIDQAARMWNRGYDSFKIAEVALGSTAMEPLIYRYLWRGIITRAKEVRSASTKCQHGDRVKAVTPEGD